ncbi:MAG TPA: hypothetical protein VL418_13525 [Devosiaceae bacterium]|jgi:hypothetical protein|nr:hypothetical protein [Devosiaceae bacterium]
MTAILLRVIIYVLIIGFVWFSARRIWRDFKAQVGGSARPAPPRDIRQPPPQPQQAADVIDLKRGADGVYRSPGDRDGR